MALSIVTMPLQLINRVTRTARYFGATGAGETLVFYAVAPSRARARDCVICGSVDEPVELLAWYPFDTAGLKLLGQAGLPVEVESGRLAAAGRVCRGKLSLHIQQAQDWLLCLTRTDSSGGRELRRRTRRHDNG